MSQLVRKVEIERGWFGRPKKLPRGHEGAAVVVLHRGRFQGVLRPGETLSMGERIFGDFEIYEVDLQLQTHKLSLKLETKDDAFFFQSEITLNFVVSDPEALVTRVKQPVEMLVDRVTEIAHDAASHYRVRQYRDAQKAIKAAILAGDYRISALSLEEVTVRITLDEKERAHVNRLAELDQQEVEAVRKEQLTATIEEARAARLKRYLDGGELGMLIYELQQDPAAMSRVRKEMLQRRNAEEQRKLEILREFLDKDYVEGSQLVLDDDTIRWFQGVISKIFATDQTVQHLASGGSDNLSLLPGELPESPEDFPEDDSGENN